jgi:Na+/melibiose symporter-like transporter
MMLDDLKRRRNERFGQMGLASGWMGLVPAVLMGLGALALRGFPITRARHAALQRSLQS